MSDHLLPEQDTAVIVLVGWFNPRIFQPAWFVSHGLLPPDEGSSANVQIINNDLCIFETEWCRVEVVGNRASFRSQATPVVEALRDLAVGAFGILHHAPVTKIGLNSGAHFALEDEQAWHRFGHLAAPKERLWGPIIPEPGTLSLTIQGRRPDDHDGHIQVKLRPSGRVANGIFIETNEEFRSLDATSSGWAVKIMQEEWESYRGRVKQVRDHLLGIAMEKP